MLWGEPISVIAQFMQSARAVAGENAEGISFSVSTRPILGNTEEQAWARAHDFLARAKQLRSGEELRAAENIGAKRLLDLARQNEVYDSCLWMEIAAVTGAYGNTTALVGTPETVAQALFEYYKVGATRLLIRGFGPLYDIQDYGRELIPRLRELVAAYDRDCAKLSQESVQPPVCHL